MNHSRPGMIAAIQAFAKSLEGPVNAIMDAFYGVDVRTAAHVKRGGGYYTDRDPGTNRRTLLTHPLDELFAGYKSEPSIHIEVAVAWIYDQALLELDRVEQEAKDRVDRYNAAQRERTLAWMGEHGVTQWHLMAAAALRRHKRVTGDALHSLTVGELADLLRTQS